jgi:mannose-6-phosphate isomerase-like protein (cupin superfamily)
MAIKIQPFQEDRPWGHFRQFCKDTSVTVKIISVNPNEMLSLQSHTKREEFWRVIEGHGVVEIENNQQEVKPGDEIFIPIGARHRLVAKNENLEVLEISFGEFSEDDITRYDDKYKRV